MNIVKTAVSGRGLRWTILAGVLVLLAPFWLLASESGLAAALHVAQKLSGGRLTLGAGAGRLSGTFSVRDIVYSTGRVTVRIDQATLNLRLTRLLIGRLQAESLDVQTLAVAAPASADPPGKPLTVRAPLRLAVEQGALHNFRLTRGTALVWILPEARFSARWHDEWITATPLKALTAEAGEIELSGRLAIVDDRLRFEDFEMSSALGAVRIEGALGIGTGSSDLKLSWKDLRPPNALWLVSAQGALELHGPWQNYGWSLEGDLEAAAIAGALSAGGRGNLEGVAVERSLLKLLGGSAQGEGRFDWRGGARADLALSWQQLNPGVRFEGWPGELNGSGRFRGDWRDATPQLEFQASLERSRLRDYPLALQLRGNSEQNGPQRRVVLEEFQLQSGATLIRARGPLLPEFGLSGSLASPDLKSLWAGLQGRAQLQAELRGTVQAPRLQLSGTGSELAFRNYRAAHATLAAQVAPRGHSDLRLELAQVDAGVVLNSALLTASGSQQKHSANLAARAASASGSLALAGAAAGGDWRGQLTGAQYVPEGGPDWQLEAPAALAFADGSLRLDPACLVAAGSRACVQFQAGAARQFVALRADQFELRHGQALLPPDWSVSGVLSGTAALTVAGGELHDLRADLATSAGALAGGGFKLDFGANEFQVMPDGRNLRARWRLTPAGGVASGDLLLAPAAKFLDRGLQGDITLNLPTLGWLPVLSPEIAAAEGALTGELRASGSLRSPSLAGRLAVAGGRVLLSSPGTEFTGLSATFENRAGAPLTVSARATVGEGWLQLDGALQSLQPRLVGAFALTGDNARLFNTAELQAWVTPNLKLAFTRDAARLTGDLNVGRALITPRMLGSGGMAPSSDQVLVSGRENPARAPLNIETEVRIVLGDAVRFDGLGLKTQLTGAITALDDPGRPTRARGELQLVGGRYRAYGQDLQIDHGRLLFSGGLVTEPAVDISASRKPREDIRVGLRARGALAAPAITLFSEPAMSQEEQLSWLVLGHSLSETLKSGQGAELAGAAVSLGIAGDESMAQRLGTRLGFDEMSVGARPGEAAEKARFTIGKYLSPKLFVSYGVGLFQPGNFFRLQYDLGRGFKLSGESGVTSGGDLLYSIER